MYKILTAILFSFFLLGCSSIEEEVIEEVELNNYGTISPMAKAMNWLKAKQNEDGTWGSPENRDILTPLVILGFLTQGETPCSQEYGTTVIKGIKAMNLKVNDEKQLDAMSQKEISLYIWSMSESYYVTKISMLKKSLLKLLTKWKVDYSSPQNFLAAKSVFYTISDGNKELDIRLNKIFDKYLELYRKKQTSLLGQAVKICLPYDSDKIKKKTLYKELGNMNIGKWNEAEKPMFVAVFFDKIIWDTNLAKQWRTVFREYVSRKQTATDSDNMAYWDRKGLNITGKLAFPELSGEDENIYITSMILAAIYEGRRLPSFKSMTNTENEDIDDDDTDDDIILE